MSAPCTQCPYCNKDEAMNAIGIEVAKLSVSTVYLFREQSHPGRVIVAYNDHVSELVDLRSDQRDAFFADVAEAARAVHEVYHPDKINYGAYGDLMPHLHFHLVPKYRDQFEWGGIFTMNPQQAFLKDEEYQDAIKRLREKLG
jgi:Diadenosine tetraphosphate (Ap4A) hydrolase and other HIT family hydrolases